MRVCFFQFIVPPCWEFPPFSPRFFLDTAPTRAHPLPFVLCSIRDPGNFPFVFPGALSRLEMEHSIVGRLNVLPPAR